MELAKSFEPHAIEEKWYPRWESALSDRPDLQPQVLNQASHEIARQYLSSEKAHRVLGWTAHYSLAEGLRRTLAWYREFFTSH